MKTLFSKLIFCLLLTILTPCLHGKNRTTQDKTLPLPTLNYGNATLNGHIDPSLMDSFQLNSLTLYAYNPFYSPFKLKSLVHAEYEIPLSKDGSIHAEIPMFSEAIGALLLSYKTETIFIGLAPNRETTLNISLENGKIKTTGKSPFPLSSEEVYKCFDFYANDIIAGTLYNTTCTDPGSSIQERKEEILKKLLKQQNRIDSLPSQGKELISYDNKILKLIDLFDYSPKSNGDRSYYRFLKDFHLDDPYYLYSTNYGAFMEILLDDSILAIPPITEKTVPEWLAEVKPNLQDLLGFKKGQFYDLLAASAYYQQLDQKKTLSETQKKNIKDYFTTTGTDRFLFHTNSELEEKLSALSPTKIVICETPQVPVENLLEKILEKYKGKAVVVDFWATWCRPCLNAMEQVEPIKKELKDKDIVYVYISDTSSPQHLWKSVIEEHEGEHYYLNEEDRRHLMREFEASAIPFYLFYDRNGILRHRSIGFMGTENLKNWIQECL